MTSIVHLTQYFTGPNDPEVMFADCDRLMDALVDLQDDAVTDPAVSADATVSHVTVEVRSSAEDNAQAERQAVARIQAAFDRAGLRTVEELTDQRQVELVLT